MILTEAQQQEISTFIGSVPKYQETYNELYDHILSSLTAMDEEEYSIDLVARVINEDFGGFQTIVKVETEFNKLAIKNCMRDLRQEMKSLFYFPEAWKTVVVLILCSIIFQYSPGDFKVIRILFVSTFIVGLIPIGYYWGSRLLYKKKGSRPSIKDNGFAQQSLVLAQTAYTPFFIFVGKDSLLPVGTQTCLLIGLFMIFFSSIFVRAYFKLYKRNVKILRSQ